jgi:hypothetical protein
VVVRPDNSPFPFGPFLRGCWTAFWPVLVADEARPVAVLLHRQLGASGERLDPQAKDVAAKGFERPTGIVTRLDQEAAQLQDRRPAVRGDAGGDRGGVADDLGGDFILREIARVAILGSTV